MSAEVAVRLTEQDDATLLDYDADAVVGGVIGAVIVFGLREYLSTLVPWWQYVLGGVYVLTIFYLPTGLMGIPERIRQYRQRAEQKDTVKDTTRELKAAPH